MSVEHIAEFAEILLSEEYTEARNNAFALEPEKYFDQRVKAEELIFNAIRRSGNPELQAFELRRQATLASLSGEDLGLFNVYIHALGGKDVPAVGEAASLDMGEASVVSTNSMIINLNKEVADPVDFLEGSLLTIAARKRVSDQNIGPENYCTALKFFTDKYRAGESELPDDEKTRELVSSTMRGFLMAAETDEPNIVELTNVFFAIRELPIGSFGPELTGPLLRHALQHMPSFEHETLRIFLNAMHKLELSPHSKDAAVSVDLAIRKMNGFETTKDMRAALRAISNLPPSRYADETIKTFLGSLNGVETTLDMEGAEEVSERLLKVIENTVSDLELVFETKRLGFICKKRAEQLVIQSANRGALTQGQLKRLHTVLGRIDETYARM